jgi:hypothetical protein
VALATLSLALMKQGGGYVAIEARSMVLGSVALAVYSLIVCQLLMRLRWPALRATGVAMIAWLAVAVGLQRILLG